MVFQSVMNNSTRLIIDGQKLQKNEEVSNCCYLGVTVDDELKWTEHTDYINNN